MKFKQNFNYIETSISSSHELSLKGIGRLGAYLYDIRHDSNILIDYEFDCGLTDDLCRLMFIYSASELEIRSVMDKIQHVLEENPSWFR